MLSKSQALPTYRPGVLMICDPRLIAKHYGKRIWQSLPAFRRTREEKVAVEFFAQEQAGN